MDRTFNTALEAVDVHTNMVVTIKLQWRNKNRMLKEWSDINRLLINVRRLIDELSILEVTHRQHGSKNGSYTKKALDNKRQEILDAMEFIDKMNFLAQLSL